MTATRDAKRLRTRAKEARRRRVQESTAGVTAGDILAGNPGLGVTVKAGRRPGELTLTLRIDDPDGYMDLLAIKVCRQLLDELETVSVARARVAGESWDEIAGLLEMSRQGAQKKHKRAEELASEALRSQE